MSNNLTYGSHAYSPSGYQTHINNFPYLFETIVMPPSFGTHYTKLTHFLSAIGSIKPASNYFIISFLAHLALGGVNVLRCSILGLHSLWSWMMWVKISRGMPMMSAIVHPLSLIYLLNTSKINFTCHSSKSTIMITSNTLCAPKNACRG